MKRFLIALATLGLLFQAPLAHSAPIQFDTVTACNAGGLTAGHVANGQMDVNGNVCMDASVSGTFDDAAIGSTGSSVPASVSYDGINVAGNLVGQTGVNPSGSVYAGQTDLTSVAGVTPVKGNGVTGTGSPRVTIASDNTPFHVIVDSVTTAPTTAVTGTFWQATQPVSAASLPLPTGAATSAKQDTANTSLATVATAATPNTYVHIAAAGTTTKTATFLHTVCVNALGTVARVVKIEDAASDTTPVVASVNSLSFLGCQTYDVTLATGLTIVVTGTVAPDVTVSYR